MVTFGRKWPVLAESGHFWPKMVALGKRGLLKWDIFGPKSLKSFIADGKKKALSKK